MSIAIAIAFVVGIAIASILWARDVRDKDRRAALTSNKPELEAKPPFKRTSGILSEAEAPLFKMIKYVIADDGHVLAKVPLSSLVAMSPGEKRREFYLNIIRSRHVDFVICHNKTFAPVLVVQAMDTGVKIQPDEQELLLKVLEAIGLPLLQLSAKQSYGPVEMRQKLRDAMNQLPPGTQPTPGTRAPASTTAA